MNCVYEIWNLKSAHIFILYYILIWDRFYFHVYEICTNNQYIKHYNIIHLVPIMFHIKIKHESKRQ